MINSKVFLRGLFSIKRLDSPGIALGASFIAIGALLKNIGFTIHESIFSSFLIYALPGSLVLAESIIIGASLLNIFLAVWLVNARLYPMTVSLMPLIMEKNQPRWKYYLSCHFVAVSSWLIMKNNYKKIEKKYRIDYWIGIGTATWLIAIFSTIIGYFSADRNFDTCIALRTALIKNNKFYIQSGAGIVADSVPEKEYLETVNKAKALISSLN